MGPVHHLGVYPLDKYIGDLILVQHCIQVHVSAENLALAGFNDQSLNILGQNILQDTLFLGPAVGCVLQDDAVSVGCHHLVHALYQAGKNIVGYVGCNNRDIP